MNNISSSTLAENLNSLRDVCYNEAKRAGWHDRRREDGTMIALIHSEISEALEGLRRDTNDEHLPARKSAEVELADAIIRILDLAGLLNFDIGYAVIDKLHYNRIRPDWKRNEKSF